MVQIHEQLRVKVKVLIKPMRHRYFFQPALACSKSTIEILEQGVKYV